MDKYPQLNKHITERNELNRPKQIEHKPPEKPQPSSSPLKGKDPPSGDKKHHGTAVASMAGGNTLGVARDATLYSTRVGEGSECHV